MAGEEGKKMGTLYEVLSTAGAVGEGPSRPTLGSRETGEWVWLSWEEVVERSVAMAHGLPGGLEEATTMRRVALSASAKRTQAWLLEPALGVHSRVLLPLHPDLLVQPGLFALLSTVSPSVVVLDSPDAILQLAAHAAQMPSLKEIVLIGDDKELPPPDLLASCTAAGLKLSTMQALEEAGDNPPHSHHPPSPNDLAVLAFPRTKPYAPSRELSHAHLAAQVRDTIQLLSALGVGQDDVYYSPLPLSSTARRLADLAVICLGARVGLGDELLADAPTLHPTLVFVNPDHLSALQTLQDAKAALGGSVRFILCERAPDPAVRSWAEKTLRAKVATLSADEEAPVARP